MGLARFIVKVFALSAVLSVLVKYGGQLLPLVPNTLTALTLVSLPALTMGMILWVRDKSYHRPQPED